MIWWTIQIAKYTTPKKDKTQQNKHAMWDKKYSLLHIYIFFHKNDKTLKISFVVVDDGEDPYVHSTHWGVIYRLCLLYTSVPLGSRYTNLYTISNNTYNRSTAKMNVYNLYTIYIHACCCTNQWLLHTSSYAPPILMCFYALHIDTAIWSYALHPHGNTNVVIILKVDCAAQYC